MKKIVFIAKTDLNTDGRILNQLKILENTYPEQLIDFILLPDKPLKISCGDNVKMHIINTQFRNNKFLRVFTVLEFIVKSLYLLFKLKPHILHAQDTAIVQPVILYKFFRGSTFKLIYDDHEIPNENERFTKRILNKIEELVLKKADHNIFANEERMEVLRKELSLKTNCSYFLNLPYFDDEESSIELSENDKNSLNELDNSIRKGCKFIVHQGVLRIERGEERLAELSRILPEKYKILLLGGNEIEYEKFIEKYKLDKAKFYFRGSVNYLFLPKYWERGIASIVMYLPTYINNRLCAPNRFYISIQKGLPVIVNKNNPVLSNFIEKYHCGTYIEDLNATNISRSIENLKIKEDMFKSLKKKQVEDFLNAYR
ncbi:hypothetical protein SAMN05216474_1423 [Lishizhenia tianjinensis]|uniref:Uncharacterized protein n=1 Tax=Lishizhenia tianjinensis TaxID=477690 RepID=A0A1I6ZJZ4_9FLAO|nr:hypothetical protein [Lishizhenia tianjinensis]SFT62992.1 hypothetical protein SAMN05216474_1423 [Lishizhenia tianjinensis]